LKPAEMVHLLVTGGLGFLGLQTARHFLKVGRLWNPVLQMKAPLSKITLFDVGFPSEDLPSDVVEDERVRVVTGDLREPGVTDEIIDDPDTSVIHLASMVSGDTEAKPEDGWKVNVEGQRLLLDSLSKRAPGARFLFTSSTACLGPVADDSAAPDDYTKLLPQNTYGFHKAVCELMLNDYSRRGLVDGRALRLPVIVVRPGVPNAALTGAWSTVVREPLAGRPCAVPVPLDVRMPVASYQVVVRAMEVMLNDIDAGELGADRTLMLPSLSVSAQDLMDAARKLASEHSLPFAAVQEKVSPTAERVVRGMGSRTDGSRATMLGVVGDESADSIVLSYIHDYVLPGGVGGSKKLFGV